MDIILYITKNIFIYFILHKNKLKIHRTIELK